MSAARFKSKNDYFGKKTPLTEKVLNTPAPKKKKRQTSSTVGVSQLKSVFFKSAENYELEGGGRFSVNDNRFESDIESHLAGESSVIVRPVDKNGKSSWHVISFDISDDMAHPFSKAKQYAGELEKNGISSIIEVAEGGKGHYYLWIFYSEPVDITAASEACRKLGNKLFSLILDVTPSKAEDSLPLPLQGESALMQRTVFVNGVGKMIKDQRSVLEDISFAGPAVIDSFIASAKTLQPKAAPKKKAAPKPKTAKKPATSKTVTKTAPAEEKQPETTTAPAVPKADKPSVEKELQIASTSASSTDTAEMPSRILLVVLDGFQVAIDSDLIISVMGKHALVRRESAEDSPQGFVSADDRMLPVLGADGNFIDPDTLAFSDRIIVCGRENAEVALVAETVGAFYDSGSFSVETKDDGALTVRVGNDTIQLFDCLGLVVDSEAEKAETDATVVDTEEETNFVLALIGDSRIAVPLSSVDEVISPEMVKVAKNGTFRVNGLSRSVRCLDLATFSGGGLQPEQSVKALLIQNGKERLAVAVQDVVGIRELDQSAVRPFSGSEQPFAGIVNVDGRETMLLDIRRL